MVRMTDDEPGGRHDLALQEARRGLAEQAAALESLRSRAVGLLAVVGIVAGLGAPRLDGASRWFVVVGVVALLVVIGIVLAPRSFSTTVRPGVLLDDPDWQLPAPEAREHVVRYLGQSFDTNEQTLSRLGWCLFGAMILTGVLAATLLLTMWEHT